MRNRNQSSEQKQKQQVFSATGGPVAFIPRLCDAAKEADRQCDQKQRHWIKAITFFLALFPALAFAQAVRFDFPVYTTSGQAPLGASIPVLAVPNATVAVCQDSACASRATTYTSASAVTSCGTQAQLTPAFGGACTAVSDNQGNAGFWVLPGSYYYKVTLPSGAAYGPFPVTLGQSAGCPLGVTCDASYASLAAAFTAAGSGTLYCTRNWNGQTTATYTAPVVALGNCKIQPASGQVVTFSGPISAPPAQIFDTSLGGSIHLSGAQTTIYPNWFGAKMDGSTDDTAAWNAAIAACPAAGCTLQVPANAQSKTSTGIVFNLAGPSAYIRVVCAGNSSAIQGSGISIVTWTGSSSFQDSGMENCMIQDPTGNASTIGLAVGNTVGNNTRLYFRDVKVTGNSSNKLGVGILLNNTVLPNFDNVTSDYFDKGLKLTGFVNSWWSQSHFIGNTTRGVSAENVGGGEQNFVSTDIEGSATGLYSQGQIVWSGGHLESNTTNNIEVASGFLTTLGATVAGGTVLIDSNSVWTDYGGQLSGVTVTNNSTGGGYGPAGLVLTNSFNGPSLNTASTGITETLYKSGFVFSCYSAGVLTPCANHFDVLGAASVNIDAPTTITNTFAARSFLNVDTPGYVTAGNPINLAQECSGSSTNCSGASANNALTAQLLDSAASATVSLGSWACFTVVSTHTLQAGANTMNLNKLGVVPIVRRSDLGNIGTAQSAGAYTLCNGNGSVWILNGAS